MMLIAMTVLWGGLAVAIYSLTRRGQGPDEVLQPRPLGPPHRLRGSQFRARELPSGPRIICCPRGWT